jgi:ribose 5-phosphate isomerase RpiB
MDKIYIRSKHFTYEELQTIIKQLKELNYEWIANVDYIGSSDSEEIDVTFSLLSEDLGEFLSVVFSCGYFHVFER